MIIDKYSRFPLFLGMFTIVTNVAIGKKIEQDFLWANSDSDKGLAIGDEEDVCRPEHARGLALDP